MADKSTISHFSQSNPNGTGQGDVAALLRRVADTLEELGDVTVQDITFSSEVTGGEDDLTPHFGRTISSRSFVPRRPGVCVFGWCSSPPQHLEDDSETTPLGRLRLLAAVPRSLNGLLSSVETAEAQACLMRRRLLSTGVLRSFRAQISQRQRWTTTSSSA
jgi:hypothetical protein